jgi:hypothetical protein
MSRKSCPGAPTEGTRHRCGKGADPEHRVWLDWSWIQPPARGGPVEAVGARPFRAKAKRRKASVVGESASSDEALYPPVPRAYWRRDVSKSLGLTQ